MGSLMVLIYSTETDITHMILNFPKLPKTAKIYPKLPPTLELLVLPLKSMATEIKH